MPCASHFITLPCWQKALSGAQAWPLHTACPVSVAQIWGLSWRTTRHHLLWGPPLGLEVRREAPRYHPHRPHNRQDDPQAGRSFHPKSPFERLAELNAFLDRVRPLDAERLAGALRMPAISLLLTASPLHHL